MKRFRLLVCVLPVFFCFMFAGEVFAQVSFGSSDSTEATVTVDGLTDTYTLIRDFKKADQWYYVPNRVRLAEKAKKGGKKMPVFSLIKYQADDSEKEKGVTEGALLQFSVSLSPKPAAIPQMKKKLHGMEVEVDGKKVILDQKTVKLAPMPIDSAEVTMFKPNGDMLEGEVDMPGIAPTFANQEMPFQITLKVLGADVYEDLVKQGGGIPVLVTFNYTGVTPPVGAKVTVDWDQSFKHFSTEEKSKQNYYNWCWYWWANPQTQERTVTKVSEELSKSGAIKVESIGDSNPEGFTQAKIDEIINPILEKFKTELFEGLESPEKIDPAGVKDPANPNAWHGTCNFAMKDVSKRKKGSETFEIKQQTLVQRKTSFGGVIGIGEYPKEVQDELVTTMSLKNWNKTFFLLPFVGDGLGIQKIDLQVLPMMPDKKTQIKNAKAVAAIWKPGLGWVDKADKEMRFITFPMQGAAKDLGDEFQKCFYQLNLTITQKVAGKVDSFKFTSFEKMVNGDAPVSTPLSLLEGFEVDAEGDLVYEKDNDGQPGVYKVGVNVKSTSPAKTYNATVNAKSEDKVLVFLVEKEDTNKKNPVIVDINFEMFGGKKIKWINSGKNIREVEPSMSLTLWQKDIDEGK
ncbi:MAG: hypothetical protein HQM10_22685 [Candidatus Riflebacteria bacterium]|nr:hypothetical protein [Candidatus Riflebacteria bacterium]